MWHQCNHRDWRGNGIHYITLATILWEWRELIWRIYNDNKAQYTSSHTGIIIRAGRLFISSGLSCRFLHRVADGCPSTSEEFSASVFRVTDSDSVNYEVCWEERNMSDIRKNWGKSGQSVLWETETYMECSDWPDFLQLAHISDTVLSPPTYFSIQVNQIHSPRRWKQYVPPKRRKTRLPKRQPLTYPVALPGSLFIKCAKLPSSTTITNIIALTPLYVTVLQKSELTKSYVTLTTLGIKTSCVLSNIQNIKQFSVRWSCHD
jgi:hypothetical protein